MKALKKKITVAMEVGTEIFSIHLPVIKKNVMNTVVDLYSQFHFLWFQLPVVDHGLKILNENF